MVSPAEVAVRTVASGAVQSDAFEMLMVYAGLDNSSDLPPSGHPLTPDEAARVLAALLKKPVTLANFPPRMGASHLLREVLAGGEVSQEELLRRVERFNWVAVLRPDGYLASVVDGSTLQKVAPVEWNDGAFRARGFELGRFYTSRGGAYRLADAQMREAGPLLAEQYDDADYVSRTLDGAEEAFIELALSIGKLLTYPSDSLAALQHLPAGLAALIASSPEYLERFKYMTRGEQVQALSKLTTTLIVTWGAAGGTTRTLTAAMGGAEATVPVLSLTAEGALVMERIVVPVGAVATAVGTGVGGVYVLSTGSPLGGEAAREAQGIDQRRFRLRNVPFFAFGVSVEDVVFTRAAEGIIEFEGVSMRGGHSTYRIITKEAASPESFKQNWQALEQLGCTYEQGPGRLRAMDVPQRADIYKVYELLERGEQEGVWEFEEGYCGHPLNG
jgi:hypothetical protein